MKKNEWISYQAINIKDEQIHNFEDDSVNAITWGVFKGKEVIQPTVVDHNAFSIWKDEVFSDWLLSWGVIYENESPSYQLLERINKSFYLVNVVDNNYIEGDLSKMFSDFIDEN